MRSLKMLWWIIYARIPNQINQSNEDIIKIKRLKYFTTLKTVVLFIMSFSRSINKLMNPNEVKIHFHVASKLCLNIDLRPFFKFNLLVLPWHTHAKRLSHMNVINISRKRTPMILLPRVTWTLILFRCDY